MIGGALIFDAYPVFIRARKLTADDLWSEFDTSDLHGCFPLSGVKYSFPLSVDRYWKRKWSADEKIHGFQDMPLDSAIFARLTRFSAMKNLRKWLFRSLQQNFQEKRFMG